MALLTGPCEGQSLNFEGEARGTWDLLTLSKKMIHFALYPLHIISYKSTKKQVLLPCKQIADVGMFTLNSSAI